MAFMWDSFSPLRGTIDGLSAAAAPGRYAGEAPDLLGVPPVRVYAVFGVSLVFWAWMLWSPKIDPWGKAVRDDVHKVFGMR
jgi:hypothetical protein